MSSSVKLPDSPLPSVRTAEFDAVFVMAGRSPRDSQLRQLRRPPGALPIEPTGKSNIERLCNRASPLLINPDLPSARRVLVTHATPGLREIVRRSQAELYVDCESYRGTGGVLRDAAIDLHEDARILIAHGASVFDEGFEAVAALIGEVDADVVLCRDAQHHPVGLWSCSKHCLNCVPEIGYADFKEQILPELHRTCDVRVVTLDGSLASVQLAWIRDLRSYLACTKQLWTDHDEELLIKEQGVEISPDATVIDSVLLRGAKVHAGAVVARSVVGSNTVVRAGQRLVDAIASDPELNSSNSGPAEVN